VRARRSWRQREDQNPKQPDHKTESSASHV
jgi:hypothetical protein